MNFISKIIKIKYGYSLTLFDNENIVGELRFRYTSDLFDFFENVLSDEIIQKFFPDDKSVYITYLTVEDNYKNIGAANYMMQLFIEKFNKQIKYNTIFLDCCPIQYGSTKTILNEKLLTQFYEKHGFVNAEKSRENNTIMILTKN